MAFTATFLGTDILAEYAGKRYAQQAVGVGFMALLFSTLLMTLTISTTPVEDIPEWDWAVGLHQNLEAVFTPAPALLLAGMCAYLVSQFFDIYLFDTLRRKFNGTQLWLRNCVSTACSSLVDNTIFSILAWVVLAEHPLAWKTVIFTYILGTYFIRLILVLLDTPFIYWAKYCQPKTLPTSLMSFNFDITHRASDSKARCGILQTPNGTIQTPNFIFCATKAAIKGLTMPQMREAGAEIILSNTYHLLVQPGPDIVAAHGGLHNMTQWDGYMLTDSGGFQIFSLGHGGVADEIKGRNGAGAKNKALRKITEEGATFRAYNDGTMHTLTPESSIQIQKKLGADLVVVLDECTPFM